MGGAAKNPKRRGGSFAEWLRAWMAEREADPCEVSIILGYSHKGVEAWLAGRGPRQDDQERLRLILEHRGDAALEEVRRMKRHIAVLALGLPVPGGGTRK